MSGDAEVGDWTEGLPVKHCLEGSRIHPMLVESWASDDEIVSSSCREQRLWKECQHWGLGSVSAQRDNRGHGRNVWTPPSWTRELGLGWYANGGSWWGELSQGSILNSTVSLSMQNLSKCVCKLSPDHHYLVSCCVLNNLTTNLCPWAIWVNVSDRFCNHSSPPHYMNRA